MNNVVKAGRLFIGDGIPKICAPVIESTYNGIMDMAEAVYKSEADIMEWRVDYYEDFYNTARVNQVISGIKEILKEKPLLFTFRTSNEGGIRDISYEEYFKLLSMAGVNADLADIEIYRSKDIEKLISIVKKHAVVIGSYHDFNGTPGTEEIIKRLIYMESMGADIPKIAVMPKDKKDVIRLMEASLSAKEQLGGRPVITMSMAKMGLISRIAAEITGSAVTFGCIGKPSAPGQIEVKRLKELIQELHL